MPERDLTVEVGVGYMTVRRATRIRQAQDRLGPDPLRVRRIERVKLHADLTILAQLASALLTART